MSASLLGLGLAAHYALHHATPILRERMIQTLSQTFNSTVELDAVDISLLRGIEVQGHGLRIPFGSSPQGANVRKTLKPLLSVDTFRFHTSVAGLLHYTAHLETVRVDGVELHIPPGAQRPCLLGAREGRLPAGPERPAVRPRTVFTVADIEATHTRLFIESETPGKEPLEFDIGRIHLDGGGPGTPWNYTAELVNPRPVGNIATTGHIGPWNGDDPRQTHVDGGYSFQHADLSSIRGISGHLSSTGQYSGPLQRIAVEGETDTPDFSLNTSPVNPSSPTASPDETSHHPMPLHTRFRAHVDGTDGDTYLDRVDARLSGSAFSTWGKLVKVASGGHDIALEVNMDHGRIEDLLLLAVRTRPPLMNGVLRMQARLHIPPGHQRVMEKLDLRGRFEIHHVHFNNAQFQDRVDGLSARAQGKLQEVTLASRNRDAEVGSEMSARFTLIGGLVTAEDVVYKVPGATVLLHGVFSTDGNGFEFKGHARTQARASQMVGGWKGWLLKPVDPFLAKHGAGLELPIQVSGINGEVHLDLALKDTDEPSAAMANDLRETRAGPRAQVSLPAQAKTKPDASREANPTTAPARNPTAADNLQLERDQRRRMFAAGGSAGP